MGHGGSAQGAPGGSRRHAAPARTSQCTPHTAGLRCAVARPRPAAPDTARPAPTPRRPRRPNTASPHRAPPLHAAAGGCLRPSRSSKPRSPLCRGLVSRRMRRNGGVCGRWHRAIRVRRRNKQGSGVCLRTIGRETDRLRAGRRPRYPCLYGDRPEEYAGRIARLPAGTADIGGEGFVSSCHLRRRSTSVDPIARRATPLGLPRGSASASSCSRSRDLCDTRAAGTTGRCKSTRRRRARAAGMSR